MVRNPRNHPTGAAIRRKADRRAGSDRRQNTRKGRRNSDPAPKCPSCGLAVPDAPHASEKDCIAALRRTLEQLIREVPIDKDGPTE